MENNFQTLGVNLDIVAQLGRLGITVPTPIQAQSIPIALTGADLIGVAQTGTGKTLAFGLPVIQQLIKTPGQALILLPTRELAEQVENSLLGVGRQFGLRTALIIGGAPMYRQLQALNRQPRVIIATPGRLVDHLERRSIKLDAMRILVLDEADRMLDMGFAPQVNQILATMPTNRQTLLFSATMPDSIKQLTGRYMRSPQTVAVAAAGATADKVEQAMHVVPAADKLGLLHTFLRDADGPVLVFTRTKHGAKKLCHTLNEQGERAAEIHGNRSLSQRRHALGGFKAGTYRVLVATDVAARGIDVNDIALVVNYDLPEQAEDYVHRIGRTARAGKTGKAVSFATPDQHRDVQAIERTIRIEIPRTHHVDFDYTAQSQTNRRFRPQGGGNRSFQSRRPFRGPRRQYTAR